MLKFLPLILSSSRITVNVCDRSCAGYVINSSLLMKSFLVVTHTIVADTRMKKYWAAMLFCLKIFCLLHAGLSKMFLKSWV